MLRLAPLDHPILVEQEVRDAGHVSESTEQVKRCRHGHEMTEDNTYHHPNGKKICRRCKRRHKTESQIRVSEATERIAQIRLERRLAA